MAEIAPAVADFLSFFEASTHGLQDDPRVRVQIGDAFRVLQRGGSKWDIIVSEPSNPWVTGVDQLFSREFYAVVREHLQRDGLFVQWVQRYATSEQITALVTRTLRSEFPYLRVFRGSEHDDLFLASRRPVGDERFAGIDALLRDNVALRDSLAEIGVRSGDDLLEREVPERLERVLATDDDDAALESLDRPRIHYLSGRAFFAGGTLDEEVALGL